MNAQTLDLMLQHELPAAARGNQDAYGRIVSACQNTVTAIAYAITRDVQASEDIAQEAFLADDVERDFSAARTLSERLSDHLATFGGSWMFIIVFGVVLAVWMALNVMLGGTAFDPYPFILLNLVLSCLAALQAPVIMMSQRRLEARDRLRAQHDYKVNLKAELEIRQLHDKVDHLIVRQWERLAELQQLQIEIMQDIAALRVK